MALIFDSFPTIGKAAGFAAVVKNYGRDAQLYTNADEGADAGYFPFQLGGNVVIVDRETYDDEEEIIQLVNDHGGRFAGT